MKQSILSSWAVTAIGLVLAVILVVFYLRRQPILESAMMERNRIDEQLRELKIQEANLQSKKDYLQSSQYIQLLARLKLNYKKADEKVVYVYHPDAPVSASDQVSQEKTSFWKRVWYYVLGK